MKRILTGIKPTGSPHIGNYLGAIRPALALASAPETTAMYFIADYHALTTVHDGTQLDHLTREVAATWIAFGLDPEKTLLYRQSDVPETFELAWVLACFTSKGWMNKMHAYKAHLDASKDDDKDAGINVGIYTYPILMAADILLFDVDLVPVGKDQVQHVEIARDMAQRLNHTYKREVLRLPAAKIEEDTQTVIGLDGRKMSK
ncbi:MAG TPA: tryptophan--tRNA ligase, partial [Kofleriaceae bacterium]|nr:tryptophan--tRNA ligase [Kofleriaceae bacterium]